MTFFNEVYVSQFMFGRHTLPDYTIKETKIGEPVRLGGATFNTKETTEEPIPLARFSGKMKTYHKEKS